ncbi:hypothetical protein ACHAWT_007068 [Skeletonema menzelii]
MNDSQSNSNGNTPAGNTPSPLDGNTNPTQYLLPYNSLAATASSAQQQQLYAQAARAQQSVAATSPLASKLPETNNIGGVPLPPMAAGTPTNLRIEAAAQYAAGAAVPYTGNTGAKRAAAAVAAAAAGSNSTSSDQATKKRKVAENKAVASSQSHPLLQAPAPQISMGEFPDQKANAAKQPPPTSAADAALIQKQQSNRDRNREHARSTRLRKKAYVNKLKELLDALHVERSDDDRKRRVAVQKLAEIQDLRRKVVNTFFGYHARCERNVTKWRMILEDDFWLKQPVTPYRSFRRCEIEKGSRITKGAEGMAEDAASMSVMIETIGSRNLRWLRRKRDYFLSKSNATTKLDRVGRIRTNAANAAAAAAGGSRVSGSRTPMPHSIVRQNSRLQHAISSLSSSSESGHGSSAEDIRKVESISRRSKQQTSSSKHRSAIAGKKVSCSGSSNQLSSSSNDTRQQNQQQQEQQQQGRSNDYHDYHAPSLLDPLPESSDSVASDNCVVAKHMLTTDSSSEDDETKPKKQEVTDTSGALTGDDAETKQEALANASRSVASVPPNIARSGISHSVKVLPSSASLPNGHAQLARAPAVALPPFIGIGKKSSATTVVGVRSGSSSSSSVEPTNNQSVASTAPTAAAVASHNANNNMMGGQPSVLGQNQSRKRRKEEPSANYLHPQNNFIAIDNDTTSSSSMESSREIQAYYHINEDDMILTDDVLMCPFIFRSQDAVVCGALSECVMPGMLRACFGPTNKLNNVEMIFDAMGFCQQLERASGNDSLAQIIPNSLEMALSPISEEARVITQSKAPYPIVSVNEAWSKVTGYTQVDVEGKDLSILNGIETKEKSSDVESAAKGQCACSVNVHYDVNGRDFFSFVCSYPLTNLKNEVTHLLHVFQELPSRE